MRRWALALGVGLGGIASIALAQTHVGTNTEGGLHWAVAAPQGADWLLVCRYRPITMEVSQYQRRVWSNRLTQRGHGFMAGRLPEQNGRCFLTKTGGVGPVGIALVKDGVAYAQGTNDPAKRAAVGVF